MYIWPESGSLTEVGAVPAAGGGGAAAGGGAPGGGGGLGSPGMAPAPNAGEIVLSRPETVALAAMELEDDEEHGFRRARAESGLTDQQLRVLKRRAKVAADKGYTLKGPNFIKKPLAATPDEPALARKGVTDRKEQNAGDHPLRRATDKKPEKAAEKKAAPAKETNTAVVSRDPLWEATDYYQPQTLRGTCGYGLPTPASDSAAEVDPDKKEANVQSTLAAMMTRRRKRRA